MWPDPVSNPGPLTYELGALPTVLRGPALPMVRKAKIRMADLLPLKINPFSLGDFCSNLTGLPQTKGKLEKF